jgi:hypothetical protein
MQSIHADRRAKYSPRIYVRAHSDVDSIPSRKRSKFPASSLHYVINCIQISPWQSDDIVYAVPRYVTGEVNYVDPQSIVLSILPAILGLIFHQEPKKPRIESGIAIPFVPIPPWSNILAMLGRFSYMHRTLIRV